MEQALAHGGVVAKILFNVTTLLSRKQREQRCVRLLCLDMERYDSMFASCDTFGSLAECAESGCCWVDAEIEEDRSELVTEPATDWRQVDQVTEIVNMQALLRWQALGPDVTGERRQVDLDGWIRVLQTIGRSVAVEGLSFRKSGDSPFWMAKRDAICAAPSSSALHIVFEPLPVEERLTTLLAHCSAT